MKQLYVWFVSAPRWFGAPAAVSAVVMGGVLSHADNVTITLAALAGVFLMASCHTFNSFADWAVTKFDQGPAESRSVEKAYTGGQNFIPKGILSANWTLVCALFWLSLSAIPTYFVGVRGTPWVWLFWGLVASCAPAYSYGKLSYLCETVLGLGFGSLAVCFGASGIAHPALGKAFLAGLPFLVLFGFAAEAVDQWTDGATNGPRLRNIGAVAYRNRVSIALVFGWLVSVTFITQIVLIAAHILASWTGISLLSMPLFIYGMLYIREQGTPDAKANDLQQAHLKIGVLTTLAGIFVYMILLTVGQAIG